MKAFENGGVNGVIFENNYDVPHKIFVDAFIISSMTFLGEKLRKATHMPLGVSVLWNDYRAALSIAKILNLQFIRVPVFVDEVETNYGIVKGEAKKSLILGNQLARRISLYLQIFTLSTQNYCLNII